MDRKRMFLVLFSEYALLAIGVYMAVGLGKIAVATGGVAGAMTFILLPAAVVIPLFLLFFALTALSDHAEEIAEDFDKANEIVENAFRKAFRIR